MDAIAVSVPAWGACALLAATVACDVRSRRIPNAIPLALLGLFAAYAALGNLAHASALWAHLATGTALLAAGFALHLTGRFGAGDGKLLAVCGLWLGPADLGPFLFGMALCAFALSGFALLPFEKARRMRSELPFAVAIAPPAALVLLGRTLT